ncbi:MAG: YciI family protein [Phycisphaerae bacterium]|nr:YciI family protein [Phycisphaerae bacterium]
MPQYVMVYLGGDKPATPEEGKAHFAKYMQWLSSLGDSAVSPANPLKNTSTVHPDGSVTAGGTTTMSGFTIIEADNAEAALSIARACPFLDIGGSLEVSELGQMPGKK